MKFTIATNKRNIFSKWDEEYLSPCGRWRLVVPHHPSDFDAPTERRTPVRWALWDELTYEEAKKFEVIIGEWRRRRNAVAKALELSAADSVT